jgi:hypothetical protein
VREEDWERIGRLKPEERVNLAIGMSDVCIRVCAEGVRNANPSISEKELIERVRERLMFGKRREGGGLGFGSF